MVPLIWQGNRRFLSEFFWFFNGVNLALICWLDKVNLHITKFSNDSKKFKNWVLKDVDLLIQPSNFFLQVYIFHDWVIRASFAADAPLANTFKFVYVSIH